MSRVDNDRFRELIDKKKILRTSISPPECRQILRQNENILIYLAGRFWEWKKMEDSYKGFKNYNQKYINEDKTEIACRHLSWNWLHYPKRHHRDGTDYKEYPVRFSTQQEIQKSPDLWKNYYDKQDIFCRANDRGICSIDNNSLGRMLYHLCENIWIGDTKYLTIASEAHLLAITVDYKPYATHQKTGDGYISVKFYDPNDTLVHKRALCRDSDALKELSLTDFLSALRIQKYFPHNQHMGLSKYESMDMTSFPERQEDWIFKRVAKSSAEEEKTLAIETPQTLSDQLYHALSMGSTTETSMLMERILNFEDINHFELLQAKDGQGFPGFFTVLQFGHTETVRIYIQNVLKIDEHKKVTPGQTFELLQAKSRGGCPGLCIALQEGVSETVGVYTEEILNACKNKKITLNQCLELLQAKDKKGLPGLYTALKNRHIKSVQVYLTNIIKAYHLMEDHNKACFSQHLLSWFGEPHGISLCIFLFLNTRDLSTEERTTQKILLHNLLLNHEGHLPLIHAAKMLYEAEILDQNHFALVATHTHPEALVSALVSLHKAGISIESCKDAQVVVENPMLLVASKITLMTLKNFPMDLSKDLIEGNISPRQVRDIFEQLPKQERSEVLKLCYQKLKNRLPKDYSRNHLVILGLYHYTFPTWSARLSLLNKEARTVAIDQLIHVDSLPNRQLPADSIFNGYKRFL